MKLPRFPLRRGLLCAAFALVTSIAVSAADSFEGRVHMTMQSAKKQNITELEYQMKNGKVRIDMQAPEGSAHSSKGSGGMGGMIFDVEAKQMIILMDMDGRKVFMRRPIPQPTAEEIAKRQASPDARKLSAPVATGRTEMIAGYEATEYHTTTQKGEVVELWLAKGLGTFMPFSPGGNPMMGGRVKPPEGWENFVRDGNSFPMRVVTHDTKGAETMRMEVTKVEKTTVPDSLFSTDGYTEFQMPDLGGAFNPFKSH
jgi:hypothetical protein